MSNEPNRTDGTLALSLSKAEALVLFEWLASRDDPPDSIEPGPEQTVLWRVEGRLEKMLLPEVFRPDYLELVNAARAHVLVDRS
jgi:hypothetical protein